MGQALQRKFARGVQYNMKIVIKGDRNTGKSCLFQRLQGRPFNEQYIPTNEIQVASIHWNYRTTDDVVKVEVWDVVDKGKRKTSHSSSLKLENDTKDKAEKDSTVLDAEFVDVYKGAHGVLMVMDITKPWTFKYLERELPKVPAHIPVLVLANHRDMEEHRLIPSEEVIAFIEHMERPDRCPPVHYAETSMKNGFGLKYIHKFLNLPFLLLQRETLMKQLQVNAEDTESTLEELQIHKESEEQNYEKFVSLMDRRRKEHEAKKAAAAAAAAEADGEKTVSPSSPSEDDRTGKNPSGGTTSNGSSLNEKTSQKMPSATSQEPDNEAALPQNGLTHSSTNIDEFIPEDELDAGFLDEDGGSRGKKRTNKSAAKKPPPKPVEAEQNESDDTESDSEGRNPMVAGFAEDIDSDDEDITPVVNNHVDEELDDDPFTTPKKSNTALTVELTSSEEDIEDEEDKVEVEKRNDGMKKGKEELKTDETQKRESGSMKLGFEIPVKSLMTEEPVVDGLGLATDDVDDWLNSPDANPKTPFRVDKDYNTRKSDTPVIPADDWEQFMASQMKQQTRVAKTASNSLIDMGLDGEDNGDTNEESRSRKKKEHKSGEKSKSKHKRKHKDKGEDEEDREKKEKDKERRKSRHRETDEGKDRRRSRDDEGEKKKKHRSKHGKGKSEDGVQGGVTYEEL